MIRRTALAAVLLAACSAPADEAIETPTESAAIVLGFQEAVQLEPEGETSANASLGDLDGDGDLDIVLAKGRHWPLADVVLINDGHGVFEARSDASAGADRTYTDALADLNGDGSLDRVSGNDDPDPKLVYLNDGEGNFVRSGTWGDAGWSMRNITVVDVTGDGRPDIVTANRGGPENRSNNYICPNDGSGSFPECRILSGESASTIASGDLNADGHMDLVVPHRDGGQSFVYMNDGSGGFDERLPIGPAASSTRAVAVGDVTGDGLPDIVVGGDDGGGPGRNRGGDTPGGVLLYVTRPGPSFEGPIRLDGPSDIVYSIEIVDLDLDGDSDVVLGNRQAAGAILVNEGAGASFSVLRFGDGEGATYGLAVGDVNGDGRPDIVAGRSGAPNMLYINQPPTQR